MKKKTLLYRDAGVDIEVEEKFVKLIKPLAERTFTPEVRGDIGGFAALFAPDLVVQGQHHFSCSTISPLPNSISKREQR